MRGYVEMMERLEYFIPEGRSVTDAEILAAMADKRASEIDAARDASRDAALGPQS